MFSVHTNAPPPLLILVGLGFVAGAAVIAWLSSPATLTATRTSASSVDVVIEDRLFGFVPIASEQFSTVRTARSVIPRPADSTSRTSTTRFLVFGTPKGEAFVGPGHHFFERDAPRIAAFIADPSQRELVLRTTDRGSELMRFLVAQVIAVTLAALGGWLIYLGVRGFAPDRNAGIGPA